jgi:hypothetical protein
MFWSALGRDSVVESGVKEPALTFVVSEDSEASNGSAGPGHGDPFTPEAMLNWELEASASWIVSVLDHGSKDASVV